eukprot:scaffold113240_cov25-Prasinocladus_malaysianus.AAC.2
MHPERLGHDPIFRWLPDSFYHHEHASIDGDPTNVSMRVDRGVFFKRNKKRTGFRRLLHDGETLRHWHAQSRVAWTA